MANKLRPVKCYYCGEMIDRNTEFFWHQMANQRYCHNECEESFYKKEKKETSEREQIHQKVKELCGQDYVKSRVDNQIKENLKEGRTLKGILQALDYWYDVQKHDPKEAYGGIGIVEYIYQDAQNYFERKQKLCINFDKVPEEKVKKMLDNKEKLSPPCKVKERIIKPRRAVYFKLD